MSITTRPRTVAVCCAAGRLPVGSTVAASASSNESPNTRTGGRLYAKKLTRLRLGLTSVQAQPGRAARAAPADKVS